MLKSKRAARRMILVELLKHLKSAYDLELTPDAARAVLNSKAGIDALVSFRSDFRLNELENALARLDSGTFGFCIACKKRIAQVHLDSDITRRFCPSCESEFNHRVRIPQVQVASRSES